MSQKNKKALPGGSAFNNTLDLSLTAMNTLGSLWVFALMLLICTDAIARSFFNHPFHGVTELVEFSIIGIVFLQLGDATRRGRLTRSDGFFNLMHARRPVIGKNMAALFDFLSVMFFCIVLWGAVPDLYDAWVNDYFVGEEGLFTAPKWPIKVVIVLGCAVTLLHLLRMSVYYLGSRSRS